MAIATRNAEYSEYFSQLNSEAKQRYSAKILLLDGHDPYLLKSKDFCEDTTLLPPVR